MSIEKLLKHFSRTESFPIKANDVRDWMESCGGIDHIRFVPSGMDESAARGFLLRSQEQLGVYSGLEDVATIYYPDSFNECWERFVCVKEMMHIIDNENVRTSTREGIDVLSAFIAQSPPANQDCSQYLSQVASDWMAIAKALAVLAPLPVVQEIAPLYQEGKKSSLDVALFFRIPEFFVPRLFDGILADCVAEFAPEYFGEMSSTNEG